MPIGRTQRVLETHPPIPGKNLYLSIDVRVQKAATDAFAGRPGSAVAIDPRNGQVLAMVSVPSFDPNLFVNGIGRADYTAYMTAADKPLLNRALKSAYPPGSTVKPFLALGGLEYGVRRPEDTVLSTGEFCIPGQQRCYRDDKRGGNGVVDMVRAIAALHQYLLLQARPGHGHRPAKQLDGQPRLRTQVGRRSAG